jgi:hypothetical protein
MQKKTRQWLRSPASAADERLAALMACRR